MFVELERTGEEVAVVCFKVLSQHSPVKNEGETTENVFHDSWCLG